MRVDDDARDDDADDHDDDGFAFIRKPLVVVAGLLYMLLPEWA